MHWPYVCGRRGYSRIQTDRFEGRTRRQIGTGKNEGVDARAVMAVSEIPNAIYGRAFFYPGEEKFECR
jgi:hypothetical protein